MEHLKKARTIKTFLPTDDPTEVRVIEIPFFWDGKIIWLSRVGWQNFTSIIGESSGGVYLLVGQSAQPQRPKVYIGSTISLIRRLGQHDAGKDFWESAVLYTSSSDSLTSAHILHLEKLLHEKALAIGRCELEQASVEATKLSEADRQQVLYTLEQILLILPTLGLDFLVDYGSSSDYAKLAPDIAREISILDHTAPINENAMHMNHELIMRHDIVTARARRERGKFVVLRGSQARSTEAPSLQENYREIRSVLTASGILKSQNGTLVFTQDYPFNTPSQAGCVVAGSSVNGQTTWKDANGRTYKDIVNLQLPAVLENADELEPDVES